MAQPELIAVTGATGFVGRRMVAALLGSGYSVRALVRSPKKVGGLSHPNLEWHAGALGYDDKAFLCGTHTVLHIAGVIKARRKQDYFTINADRARDLAQAAQAEGVKRFILLSSMAARHPELSHYAASKAAGEHAVKAVFEGPLCIIRAPAVFGPGDAATRPFFQMLARGILPVPGGRGWRKRVLSMVFVDDLVADIINQSIGGKADGMTRSPATLGRLTWPEFALHAERSLGHSVRAIVLPLPLLYSIAAMTSLASYLFGAGHLTLGKLREFLYEEWSSDDPVKDATPFTEALSITAAAYRSHEG